MVWQAKTSLSKCGKVVAIDDRVDYIQTISVKNTSDNKGAGL